MVGENFFLPGTTRVLYYVLPRKISKSSIVIFLSTFRCLMATLTSPNHLVSRFLLPTTNVPWTRRPHTPHDKRDSISRAVAVKEEISLSASDLSSNVQLGVGFCLILSYPNFDQFRPFSTNFDHCSTSKPRVRLPLETRGRPM